MKAIASPARQLPQPVLTIGVIMSFSLQCAMLANAVGIGGGPLFVPILATIVGMGAMHYSGHSTFV